jgi:hypothetical protein
VPPTTTEVMDTNIKLLAGGGFRDADTRHSEAARRGVKHASQRETHATARAVHVQARCVRQLLTAADRIEVAPEVVFATG